MSETRELNKLLNTPGKLAKETRASKTGILTNLLHKLINKNYTFTPTHFDTFVDRACEIVKYSDFLNDTSTINKNINTYMFTTFTPTSEQVDKILSKINNMHYGSSNYIIDIIFPKYTFNLNQIQILIDKGYKPPSIKNYNAINNNVIYAGCSDKLHENMKHLIKFLSNGYQFNDEHLKIMLICFNEYNYEEKFEQLDAVLTLLLTNVQDIPTMFKTIPPYFNRSNIHIHIVKSIINKFGFDDDFVKFIFDEVTHRRPDTIFNLMLKNYNIITNDINKILNSARVIYIPITNINNYESINLPSTYLSQFAEDTTDIYIPVTELFERFNLSPTLETLNIACQNDYTQPVDILLNKYNIIPEKSTLDISINTGNLQLIQTILNYKIIPDSDTLKNVNLYPSKTCPFNEILELLIKYGLMITLDDMEIFVASQYVLPNLERFNIPYDKELYFVCSQFDFFPEEYTEKFTIDKNILHLHHMCKKEPFENIVAFMKDKNLKLDRFCMEFLLGNGSGGSGVIFDKILETYKCMPCEYSMYKRQDKYKLTQMAIKHFKVTADTMFEEYNMTP